MARQIYPAREIVFPSALYKELEIGLACCIAQSAWGGYVAVGFKDGSVACLDSDSLSVVYRYRATSMEILALTFDKEGRRLSVVSADMTACLINLAIPGVEKVVELDAVPFGAAFPPFDPYTFAFYNQKHAFIATFSDELVTIALDTGEAVFKSAAMLPGNTAVFGTSDGRLKFVREGQVVRELNIGTSGVLKLQYFEPVNKLVALCDKSIKVCTHQSELHNYSVDCDIHMRFMAFDWSCVAFSLDGESIYAASTALNGKVLLYSIPAGVDILELEDHRGIVTALLYDHERATLLGISSLGSIFAWTLPSSESEWSYQIPDFRFDEAMDVKPENIDEWYVKLPPPLDPPAVPDFYGGSGDRNQDFVIPYRI